MRPKTMVLMTIAVGCGLAASIMTTKYLGAQNNTGPAAEEKVPVLVAVENIAPYTQLKDQKLFREEQRVRSDLPKGPVAEFRKAEGRMLKVTLKAGDALVESDLLAAGHEDIISKLKPGERAFTVKVTAITATAGFLKPGDKVDVIATQIRPTEDKIPFSQTILQDVEVLAIDTQLQRQEEQANKQVDHVTLRVTPEEVEVLSINADTGTLRLVPRRPDDIQKVTTRGARPGATNVRRSDTVTSSATPAAAPEAPPAIVAPALPPDVVAAVEEAPKPHVMYIFNNNEESRHEFVFGTDGKVKSGSKEKK